MGAIPLSSGDDDKKHTLPVTPELIDTINRAGQKPQRRLSKKILNRLERLAWSGEDVDLIVQIRGGRVLRTGHTIYYTHDTSQED